MILFMRLDMQSATWLTIRYLAGKPLTSYDILLCQLMRHYQGGPLIIVSAPDFVCALSHKCNAQLQ